MRRTTTKLHTFFLLLLTTSLWGEVTVTLTAPELVDGMSSVEAALTASVLTVADEIETTVNDLLDKPELTDAFSSAVILDSSLSLQGTGLSEENVTLSWGATATLFSDTFIPEELSELFEELSEDDDFTFGVSAHLIQSGISFPLKRYLPGSMVTLSAAYADLNDGDYFYRDLFLQGALGYAPFSSFQISRIARWSPLYGQFSVAYNNCEVGINLETGVITEEFEIDPDDGGPLLSYDVTVQLDPTVKLSLQTEMIVLTADFSSAICLRDFFHVYGGFGVSWASGGTDIAVETDEDIEVLGYLSDLIETEGSISISGAVESTYSGFIPYVYTGFQADISTMYIRIPLQYSYSEGISSGVFMGVTL
jgi:hypothetical protein